MLAASHPPADRSPAGPPAQLTVWYRGVAYVVNLATCREALADVPGDSDEERVRVLAAEVGLHPTLVQRFFDGFSPCPVNLLAILAKLGLAPRQLPPWSDNLNENLMTIVDAAAEYDVSSRTIRRWLANRRLRGYRRDGDRQLRVDRREIERIRGWREV